MSRREEVYPLPPERDDRPEQIITTEQKIEKLVGQISQLVRSAAPEKRPGLKDFTETLVREEISSIAEPSPGVASSTNGRKVNPLAAGILVLILGAALALMFTPVGLSVASIGILLIIWGAILSWMKK